MGNKQLTLGSLFDGSGGFPLGGILAGIVPVWNSEIEILKQYLQAGNPVPEAIFASNDLSAIGCITALNELGYRVPEDVSVMGCDDISLCEYTNPTLTTIRTHFQEIGTVAAQEVLRLIRGEPGRLIRQNGLLVERKSCAPADR